MPQQCTTIAYTADETVFAGAPLELDVWLPLGMVDLNLVTVVGYAFDINIFVGGSGGTPPIGPSG